jgi:uncharacterized protein YsxB (DUF464 family)
MIKVKLETSTQIDSINISGHASSDEYGKDLVCAGVSSVVFGLLNSLDGDKVDIKVEEDEVDIKAKSKDEKTQIILQALFIALSTIEDQNKEYMKIERKANYDFKF